MRVLIKSWKVIVNNGSVNFRDWTHMWFQVLYVENEVHLWHLEVLLSRSQEIRDNSHRAPHVWCTVVSWGGGSTVPLALPNRLVSWYPKIPRIWDKPVHQLTLSLPRIMPAHPVSQKRLSNEEGKKPVHHNTKWTDLQSAVSGRACTFWSQRTFNLQSLADN